MNKAIILVLILTTLFQLFSQRECGIYHKYNCNQDVYKPVYTANYNSDLTRKTLENRKYIYIAIAIIFVISEII